MRQYDVNTTEYFKVPSLLLMERAALAVFDEIKKQYPCGSKILIVCGTGNNGADGLALTRLLFLDGAEVHTVLIGDRKKETDQCKKQLEILSAYGCSVLEAIPENNAYDVIVDAIFGVGLSRNVEGIFADAIRKMNEIPGKKIALDMPSEFHRTQGLF